MEVGKLIMNTIHSKAHMTLSVKPFGCMPSAGVSDGVQSAITEKFPGTIFCPVETSGDGRVNFYSRVQMYLFKAKQVAIAEYERALDDARRDARAGEGVPRDEPALREPALQGAARVRGLLGGHGRGGRAVHHEDAQRSGGRSASAGAGKKSATLGAAVAPHGRQDRAGRRGGRARGRRAREVRREALRRDAQGGEGEEARRVNKTPPRSRRRPGNAARASSRISSRYRH